MSVKAGIQTRQQKRNAGSGIRKKLLDMSVRAGIQTSQQKRNAGSGIRKLLNMSVRAHIRMWHQNAIAGYEIPAWEKRS
jgi:molybdate-binding protein